MRDHGLKTVQLSTRKFCTFIVYDFIKKDISYQLLKTHMKVGPFLFFLSTQFTDEYFQPVPIQN
jgi:hypothetical protein